MENYRDVHSSGCANISLSKQIEDSDMSKNQKEKIIQFISDLRIGKAGKKVKDRRINAYLQFLLKLHQYFKTDIDKLPDKKTEEFYKDLTDNKIKRNNGMPYSQATKDEFTKTLKRYLGWCWGRDSKKYSSSVRWMKEDYKTSNKKAIAIKQVEQVVNFKFPATYPKQLVLRDTCLFMFLFDSGARIEEALNVKIKDLLMNKDYFIVHLRGQKTEEADRKIAVPLCTKYLNDWLQEHPTKKEDDYLFPINYDNARKIIKTMSNRALKFGLKPHELRHSSATHYIQNGGFGAENIGGFYYRYGWKFGSKEALTYIKTYLYGGELGQDKVVKSIVSDRVEHLEKRIETQQKDIERMREENEKMFKKLENQINSLQKSEEIIEKIKNKSFVKV